SIYDSYDDYRRFKDPTFAYGVALSKVAGHAILRMADAAILPFDFSILYKTADGYATNLIDATNDMREATVIENKLLQNNDDKLAADPTKTYIQPTPKDEVPFLDFSPLQNALITLKKSTDSLHNSIEKNITPINENMNVALAHAEQQLLFADGLPRRSWYKHSLYAPGFYTGYGVKTLPGIREAIEQRNWKEAQQEINITAQSIEKLAGYLSAIK
ncbi:MAG: transferrin receptor-like dimerization domain-containing protein, partial [Parafilimonas sp.]